MTVLFGSGEALALSHMLQVDAWDARSGGTKVGEKPARWDATTSLPKARAEGGKTEGKKKDFASGMREAAPNNARYGVLLFNGKV
jgi:hypothetical protein